MRRRNNELGRHCESLDLQAARHVAGYERQGEHNGR